MLKWQMTLMTISSQSFRNPKVLKEWGAEDVRKSIYLNIPLNNLRGSAFRFNLGLDLENVHLTSDALVTLIHTARHI